MSATVTAAVLIIGNEVLSGRTQDLNLQFLGSELAALGIRLSEARIIPDVEAAIIEAVDHLRAANTYVFTTGGIGPTHDDITAASIAKAFGVGLVRDPEAVRRLRLHYGELPLNPARLRMADVPEGAVLLDNPVSNAPGFRIGNVYVLAGVPTIMRAMFAMLRDGLQGGPPILARTVAAFTTESGIAEALAAVQARHASVDIGSYPFVRSGRFGVSLVARAADAVAVAAAAADIAAMLTAAGITPLIDDEDAAVTG